MSAPSTSSLSVELLSRVIDVKYSCFTFLLCFVVITDFSVNSSSNSYLRGGMTYDDGKLTVPASGEYYVYAQLYFHNNRRVHIDVNGVVINFLQPQASQSDFHGSLYAGGVYQLNAGDVISLRAFSWPDALGVKLWMETRHDFFGAFMI